MKPDYLVDRKPAHGSVTDLGDGVHWLRMPLPISLEHINLWLLDDGDGWTIVDTGIYNSATTDIWERVFDELIGERPVTRVLATHLHPDHVGCAGWLTDRSRAPLWMTRDEYLLCRLLVADTGREAPEEGVRFYRAAGFADDSLDNYRRIFGFFGRFVAPLPEAYHRMQDGEAVAAGGTAWRVVVGRGHSPEHACLHDEAGKRLISGDQLLPRISSNVSVYPTEPDANPLAAWFESLQKLKDCVDEDVVVLPAHGLPFRGAHARLDQLIDEHETKLSALLDVCGEPRRAVDVFPALFRRKVAADSMIMATGEALAHLHYLLNKGEISRDTDADGVHWFRRR